MLQATSHKADEICDLYGVPHLDRIHTVEPAQSHAYQCKDLEGFTTTRGIFPPFGRKVARSSESQEIITVNHGNVETSETVSPALHQAFCENYMRLMRMHGRAHGISYDRWEKLTKESFTHFILHSPLQTHYYDMVSQANQSHLRKETGMNDLLDDEDDDDAVMCMLGSPPGECAVCAE
jgi:hypothetical protein